MRLHFLKIRNFRGIKQLDWKIVSPLICLVGHGDSTKSTILAAINYALLPYFDAGLSEIDFFNCKLSEPIFIEVTLSDVPDKLLTEEKFGHFQRCVSTTGDIVDDPEEGLPVALTVRLQVDDTFEPKWTVYKESLPDGKSISHGDRASLGMMRIDDRPEDNLTWSRGSALYRLTEDRSELMEMLTQVRQSAREIVTNCSGDGRNAVLKIVRDNAKEVGASRSDTLDLGFDAARMGNRGLGAIALHDAAVPMRLAGLGTRRLVALALQRQAVRNGAILLIDEIEHGLEPHRIRHLLRYLLAATRPAQNEGSEVPRIGSVIMTSHSPICISELEPEHVVIVRNSSGDADAQIVAPDLRRVLRSCADAMLATTLVVCEGDTEIGICRFLTEKWDEELGREPCANRGICLVNGNGEETKTTVQRLSKLGFTLFVFVDSDNKMSQDIIGLQLPETTVVAWDGSVSTEERLATDLDMGDLKEMVAIAADDSSEEGVCAKIKTKLATPPASAKSIDELFAQVQESELRVAIAEAAQKDTDGDPAKKRKSNGWFKRVDLGYQLGELIHSHLAKSPDTDLSKKTLQLRKLLYGV